MRLPRPAKHSHNDGSQALFLQRPCPALCMFLFPVFNDCVTYEHRVSLYLDPQIRDWVLFPITLVMVRVAFALSGIHQFSSSLQPQILVGILRHYVVLLLQSTPKKLSRAAIREQCVYRLLQILMCQTG
jgi:hypothetical protein